MKIYSKSKNIILSIFLFSITLFAQDESLELSKIKHQINKDPWMGIDKVQHIMYSNFISLGVQYILVNKIDFEEENALPISTLASFFAGLSKEVIDGKSKKNFFSKKDMVANSIGLFFAFLIIKN